MNIKFSVLVVLSVFVSIGLSVHFISRRITDFKNQTNEANATEANDNSTLGITITTSDTNAYNLTDNQRSNSSVGNQTESSPQRKSIVNETNETAVNTTTITDDKLSSAATNQTVADTELATNRTQNATEQQSIDFTNDDNANETFGIKHWIRYETIKLKIIALEDRIKTLMNENIFYSLAIPAAIGMCFAIALLILLFCCKNCGDCSGHCLYRICCFCCPTRSRKNNRLKYSKSKHLFGDEKNYLLVSNNDSDVEIET